MTQTEEKRLKELLKSGDFTVSYHDNESCNIFKGKYENYEDCPNPYEDDSELESGVDFFEIFDSPADGYTPDIVYYLVKALGGRSNSI